MLCVIKLNIRWINKYFSFSNCRVFYWIYPKSLHFSLITSFLRNHSEFDFFFFHLFLQKRSKKSRRVSRWPTFSSTTKTSLFSPYSIISSFKMKMFLRRFRPVGTPSAKLMAHKARRLCLCYWLLLWMYKEMTNELVN